MTAVIAVRYATLPTLKSQLYHRYGTYGEPDAAQSLDYFFWVLSDDGRTVVVDTGFDPEVGARRGRTCLCPPREALARLGIEPGSVRQVIVTHFHYDHVGNLDLFADAELLVPERELEFWTSPVARRHQFAEHVEAGEIERIAAAERDGRVRAFAGEAELAPGVRAIPLPGHSPGQAGVLVSTPSGPVALASDAVHLYEEWETDRPFAVIADLEEMYSSYDHLRALCAASGAVMVPGHDPEVLTRFPTAGDGADGLAVRIA
jgi:glyoxylase-like metal-dependent hydrolase (beta-lactamase superfamily II)